MCHCCCLHPCCVAGIDAIAGVPLVPDVFTVAGLHFIAGISGVVGIMLLLSSLLFIIVKINDYVQWTYVFVLIFHSITLTSAILCVSGIRRKVIVQNFPRHCPFKLKVLPLLSTSTNTVRQCIMGAALRLSVAGSSPRPVVELLVSTQCSLDSRLYAGSVLWTAASLTARIARITCASESRCVGWRLLRSKTWRHPRS